MPNKTYDTKIMQNYLSIEKNTKTMNYYSRNIRASVLNTIVYTRWVIDNYYNTTARWIVVERLEGEENKGPEHPTPLFPR